MFFLKLKASYEMLISDWSSDVCSSDCLLMHVTCTAAMSFCFPILLRGRWSSGGPFVKYRRLHAFGGLEEQHLILREAKELLRAKREIFAGAYQPELAVGRKIGLREKRRRVDHLGVDCQQLPVDVEDVDRKSTRLKSRH